MNVSCSVIQDLLPLYHDGVCGEESRNLVANHLERCADCKDMLRSLDEEVTLGDAPEKAQPLLTVKMTWNREKRKSFFRGLAIALAVCLVLAAGWWALTGWDCVPLTREDFAVLRLAEYEDGTIQVRTTTAYQGFQCDIHYELEENALYALMKRPVIAERKALPEETVLYAGMLTGYQGGWGEISFNPEGESVWTSKDGEILPIKAYYIGVPGSREAVLIWEEGMELPSATPEDEALHQKLTGE